MNREIKSGKDPVLVLPRRGTTQNKPGTSDTPTTDNEESEVSTSLDCRSGCVITSLMIFAILVFIFWWPVKKHLSERSSQATATTVISTPVEHQPQRVMPPLGTESKTIPSSGFVRFETDGKRITWSDDKNLPVTVRELDSNGNVLHSQDVGGTDWYKSHVSPSSRAFMEFQGTPGVVITIKRK